MQFQILRRSGHFAFLALGAGVCMGLAGFGTAFAAGGQSPTPQSAGLRPALYRALVAGQPAAQILPAGCANRAGVRLKACFGDRGVHFTGPREQRLGLSLEAFGRSGALVHLGAPAREFAAGRLNYRYAGLTEWWRAVPQGFEQGFSIFRKPAGTGRLVLVMNASRSPERRGASLAWGRLRYGGLAVTDARGRRLPAAIAAGGTRVSIVVNDRNAVYPLTVDPLVWIAQSVAAPAPVTVGGAQAASAPVPASIATTASAFGAAVVLDGRTAFVGAPYTTVAGAIQQGAVYVFSEASDRSWTQSAVLTASDGTAYDQFGSRVAISGKTLLIGAPDAASARGAAYVFTQSGGNWGETGKLVAGDGAAGDEFGAALALSGTTALVGARFAKVGGNARQGAAYVFTNSAGTWSQAGKLTAGDGAANDLFGSAVALDGSKALVGAPAANVNGNQLAGAVYAFAEEAGTWSEVQKLVASDGARGDSFGSAVVLSGTTALLGAPEAAVSGHLNVGKVYVFADTGGSWNRTATLIADNGVQGNQFGGALALDAGRAFIGNGSGSGSAGVYIFERGDGGWTQSEEFLGTTGYGKALDLEGLVLLVGAPLGSGGRVFFYEPADLALAYSAPAEAKHKSHYTGNVILTNGAASASPPLSLLVLTPTGASLNSAASTQGDCTNVSFSADCKLGQVAGNGGQAKVTVNYTVKAKPPVTLNSIAVVANAVPAVTASAATRVPKNKSSGGGGELGLGLLALLGLLAAAGLAARRHR